MAGSVNKVILIGNLGRDPESRSFQNGGKVVNLRIATSESWKDKSTGERKEKTEWHSVAIFNENLGNVAERFLRKGSKVYIEGKLQTRKWQGQDGQDKYSTEIVLQGFDGTLTMLDGPGGNQGGGRGHGRRRRLLQWWRRLWRRLGRRPFRRRRAASARAARPSAPRPPSTATSTTTCRSEPGGQIPSPFGSSSIERSRDASVENACGILDCGASTSLDPALEPNGCERPRFRTPAKHRMTRGERAVARTGRPRR